ncbi:ATP-dependent DNA helicase [Trichonephila clavipes]|nr:ATP-dependent DNA helicase [Trichonephila clavipes]
MRAHSADSEFSKILLDVGEGKCPEVNSTHDIELTTGLCQVVVDTETLIHSIYDDVHDLNIKADSWLRERSILATINDQVSLLNQRMLDKIPGESQTYISINTVCNPDEVVNYPTEFLNSISVPGLPPHKLELKICVPFILLRNLNPPKLCNGTRAVSSVIAKKNVIEGRIISGCGKGSDIIGKLFTGEIKQLSERLTAVNTRLGWTDMGKLSCESKFKLENSILVHSLFTNREKISDLWELDSLGIKDPSEKKSKLELQDLALKHFENTVLRDDEGRLFDYEQVFVDWEKEGIIEKIAQDEPKNGGKFHYLPHRPVFKENSTTEIRPVFDGSAHHGKSCSLNDCVEKGPNLIEMIPAILNRFRLGKIGVISDIRKAFLQISLHENDMNFLPFLW